MNARTLLEPYLDAEASRDGILVFRDLRYGPRKDRPGEGAQNAAGFGFRHSTGQTFDVYLPENAPASRCAIYVHGGGWSQRFDKDGGPDPLTGGMARQGWCVLNMNYAMQTDLDPDPAAPLRPGVTFETMLRDIDAMVSYAAELLPALGVGADRIAIVGQSAGAHLSTLYAYDGANPAALGLGLAHRLPVLFVLDIVGPSDLTVRAAHRRDGARGAADARRMRALCGVPEDTEDCEPFFRKYSPVSLVCPASPATVMCYFRLAGQDTDGAVPAACYALLRDALERNAVPVRARLFENHAHNDTFCPDVLPWLLERTEEFLKA